MKENQQIVLGVALACAVGAACYFAATPDEKVEGTLSCPCGKVKGKFTASKSTPTVACHCEDCVGYVKWATTAKGCPADLTTNLGGVHMVQFYKDQFQWLLGAENLERVRLREDSNLERISTTCCGTPIGFVVGHFYGYPLFAVHHELLSFTTRWNFGELGWRLNVARIPEPERHWNDTPATSCVVSEGIAPSFFLRTLGRVLFGMVTGRGQPDPVAEVAPECKVLGLNVKDGKGVNGAAAAVAQG